MSRPLLCCLLWPSIALCLCAVCSVPTIDGSAEVKIKPGTQPGDKLRMRGYGVKMDVVGQRGRRGDQYVTVVVRIPRSLTADQRRLLEEYRSAGKGGGNRRSAGSSTGSRAGGSAGSSGSTSTGSSGSGGSGGSSTGGSGSSGSSSSSSPGSSESTDSKGQAEGSSKESKDSSNADEGGSKGEKEQKKKRRPFSGWFS